MVKETRIRKRKKGVFYTITSLLLMAVFIFGFLSVTKYKYSTKGMVIETRVNTINDFLGDVERDIQRAVYITSYRSLLSMTQQIVINKSYIDDAETRFHDLFFNGTYDGDSLSLMTNNSFDIWEARIKQKAAELDIEIEFTNKKFSVGQRDPWHIRSELNFTLIVGDIKGTANFTKGYNVEADVPIEYFEDPTYRLNTNGIIIKPVLIQDNLDFTDGSDTTNLELHNSETRYVAFAGAPSYLKRLEGDLSADENGIESMINMDEFTINGIGTGNGNKKSVVDYIYFSEDDPKAYKIQGLDNWFRIDNESGGNTTHLQLYEVEDLI